MLCFFAFSRIRCGFHRNAKHHGSCVNAGIFRLAVRREIQADCSAVIRGSACYGEYGIIFRDDALPVLYRVKLLGAFRGRIKKRYACGSFITHTDRCPVRADALLGYVRRNLWFCRADRRVLQTVSGSNDGSLYAKSVIRRMDGIQ